MTDQEVISELSNKTERAMEVSISIDGKNYTYNVSDNADINDVVSQFQEMVTSELSKEEKREIADSISDDVVFVIKNKWTNKNPFSNEWERIIVKLRPRNIESLEYYANHPEELQNIAEFVSDNKNDNNALNENFEVIDKHTEKTVTDGVGEKERDRVELEIEGTDISIRIVAPSVVRYQKYREELEAKWEAEAVHRRDAKKQEEEHNTKIAIFVGSVMLVCIIGLGTAIRFYN
jgi:hypothetical protein